MRVAVVANLGACALKAWFQHRFIYLPLPDTDCLHCTYGARCLRTIPYLGFINLWLQRDLPLPYPLLPCMYHMHMRQHKFRYNYAFSHVRMLSESWEKGEKLWRPY